MHVLGSAKVGESIFSWHPNSFSTMLHSHTFHWADAIWNSHFLFRTQNKLQYVSITMIIYVRHYRQQYRYEPRQLLMYTAHDLCLRKYNKLFPNCFTWAGQRGVFSETRAVGPFTVTCVDTCLTVCNFRCREAVSIAVNFIFKSVFVHSYYIVD